MSTTRAATTSPAGAGPVLAVLAAQVTGEVRQNLRVPDFVIGVVGVPVILYAMFGLPNAGRSLPSGTDVAAVMFGSFAAYGVVSLVVFAFGVDVAQERGRGWLRRLQTTPMPPWAYFAGKAAMAVVFAGLTLAGLLAVGLVAGVPLDAGRLLRVPFVVVGGALAFSTFGLALAFWARPRAAAAIGNLLFLPLSFASGFFIPLGDLPRFFQELAPFLPTYHFGQLAWAQIAPAEDLVAFGVLPPAAVPTHLAWVVGSFVLFGLLAVTGYRRDLRR